ncbi:MAG: ROK family protein [Candidatus Jorgensenbacteria bacterium]|nr:ROK family protein [Candidatus Jorgensenbacteria bacterium]
MNAIGIDVGGSKIRAVRIRLTHRERWNGTRVEKLAVARTPTGAIALTKTLRRMIAKLEEGKRLKIGTGFAGVIQSGKVVMSPNNRFLKGYDPAKALGRPVRVENDARTFARAEYGAGAGKGAARALFFTFGTGVGRAYGIGREIKRVKRFEYPEKWEKRYQRVKGVPALAPFLAMHLNSIIKGYKPRVIVAGGGVAEKQGFMAAFRGELKRTGFTGEVRGAKLGTLAGAIGAALVAK